MTMTSITKCGSDSNRSIVRRISLLSLLSILVLNSILILPQCHVALGKKSPSSRSHGRHHKPSSTKRSGGSGSSSRRRKSSPPPRSTPRYREEEENEDDEYDVSNDDEEEEEEDKFGMFEEEEDEYDEEEEDEEVLRPMPSKKRSSSGSSRGRRSSPPPSRPSKKHRPSPSSSSRSSGGRKGSRSYYDDEYDEEDDDDYYPRRGRKGSSSRSSHSRHHSSRGGRHSSHRRGGRHRSSSSTVVPYVGQATSTFTRGLSALKESIPDPSTLTNAASSALATAKSSTSKLSSTLYREVKGLTSSELEQVMLKATRPDDSPVKGKHVERLVGVTYQISGRYDIYDSVLRKLWAKMVEDDWRTTIKALYILHRFSSDGSPDHGPALKARLRELRRTRDPKRKEKYFNSKQLLAGDNTPQTKHYRAFMARYAHYVLLRAQCFGGQFLEISSDPSSSSKSKSKKKSASAAPKKPITSTSLRPEHLEAAQLLLKAGCACTLKDDAEECENTALAVERVAVDMMGLTSAVATALNRVLKNGNDDSNSDADDNDGKEVDWLLVQKWCVFYQESLKPQTKTMVKKTAARLDKYGLFLPSRVGVSVREELLQKGLSLAFQQKEDEESGSEDEGEGAEENADEEDDVANVDNSEAECHEDDNGKTKKKEEDEEVQDRESLTSSSSVENDENEDQEEDDEYDEEYDYEEYEEEED